MNFSALYPRIQPEVVGCPNPRIKIALIDTARDICTETRIWEAELTALDLVADQAEYDLAYDDADIVALAAVHVNEVEIDIKSKSHVDSRFAGWRYYDSASSPSVCFMSIDHTLTLVPPILDASTGGLRVWVNLQPTTDATDLPDILSGYLDALQFGALARLFGIENQPWSNPDSARKNAGNFRTNLAAMKTEILRGFSNSDVAVRQRGGIW